jgi:hypothetical protein
MKTCTKCKNTKEENCFYKHKKSKDGYSSWCKECRSKSFKEDYLNNKEYYNQKSKNYYNKNIEITAKRHSIYRNKNKAHILQHDKERDRNVGRRFLKSKRSAIKRKLEWLITENEFQELSYKDCYYCNNKLENRKYSTGAALDRIDNSIGYIISNVLPCCATCNYLRGDIMTVQETQQVVNLLITLRGL